MAKFQFLRAAFHFFIYLFLVILMGCSSSVETFNSTQGLGKQLEDLDQAYKANAITEKEYQKAKEILLDYYK